MSPTPFAAPAPAGSPTPRDRRSRLATFAVYFVQGLTFATLLTQVAALQDKHGISDGELTLLLLVVPVIAGVGSVLAGSLAARHGSRRVLRLAQPLACVAVILAGLAPTVPALVASNVLFGLALGAVDAGMNMQGVAVERAYGRPILTGFHALWSAAAVIGALWASAAGGLGLSLPPTFAIAMVPGIALAVAAAPSLRGPGEEHVEPAEPTEPAEPAELAELAEPAEPAEPAAAPGTRFPWRPIVPLCLAMAFLYVGDAAISNFGSVYMDQVLSASAAVIPLALGAYQATTFVVRVGGDLAVRRYGPAAIVRAGGLLAALGLAGVVFAPNEPVAIVAFGLTGVGLSVIAPQSFSAAGRLDPAGTGVAIARVNLFNYVGFIVGAALVGGVADAVDYRVAFACPLVLAATIIALAPGFQRTRSSAVPAPTHVSP